MCLCRYPNNYYEQCLSVGLYMVAGPAPFRAEVGIWFKQFTKIAIIHTYTYTFNKSKMCLYTKILKLSTLYCYCLYLQLGHTWPLVVQSATLGGDMAN